VILAGLSLLPALLASAAAHPDSISRSLLSVRGAEATLTLRFQTLSAIEVLPGLDLDGDGLLDEAELEAGEARLADYLVARWRLFEPLDDEPGVLGARPPLAVATVASTALLDRAVDGSLDFQWMVAELVFRAPEPLTRFTIESRVFLEQNPFHRDFVSVFYEDEEEVRVLFGGDRAQWTFEPSAVRRPGVLTFFLALGFEHILGGADHLAFLLVLLVAAPRLRSLVGVVTAFTVAHSITLAIAALDPGGVLGSIPGRLVELAIALSIAYVACQNLLLREPRTAWLEAFGFGLLHGLGFAGFLGDALAGEPLVVTALLGFNLGVEGGQLLVVLVAALLLFLTSRRRSNTGETPALAPPGLRRAVSVLVAVVALYWFVQRAGWLDWIG
jgi:hypothetical protein